MTRVICTDIFGLPLRDYLMLYQKCSPERKARADRYRRREDALRCVAAGALLRHVLGTSEYTVERSESGKPYIRERANFHFNLSHSGDWVVLAYSDSEVGVDVEKYSDEANLEAIARRFFAPEEKSYVLQAEEGRVDRFYEIWTGKESYLKYLGTGLKKDLTSFSVLSLAPQLRLHRQMLDENHCLCLCTTDNDCLIELLDVRRLVKGESK